MQITLNLPNDFVTLQSPVEIEQDMRLSYALWLFKFSKVTLSKAAELAELTIYDFISACKKNDIAVIDMTKDELLEELADINLPY
jgi:predicted HTH domain antitoxin